MTLCPLASGPSAGPTRRCIPLSSLMPTQLLQVSFWGSEPGCVTRLFVCLWACVFMSVCVLRHVCRCVCFQHPAVGSSRWVRSVITELGGRRQVFDRFGWRWRNLPESMLGNYQQKWPAPWPMQPLHQSHSRWNTDTDERHKVFRNASLKLISVSSFSSFNTVCWSKLQPICSFIMSMCMCVLCGFLPFLPLALPFRSWVVSLPLPHWSCLGGSYL